VRFDLGAVRIVREPAAKADESLDSETPQPFDRCSPGHFTYYADRVSVGRREQEDVDSQLTVLERARAAWPTIDLSDDRFARHLASKIGDEPAHSFHTDDLYLACACAEGLPRALEAFDRECLPAIDRPVSRLHGGAAIVSEVRQLVREIVLLPRSDAPPRIAEFSGRSKLSSWLRVIAVREAMRSIQKNRREALAEDEAIAAAIDRDADPELRYFKQLYRAEFNAALREAIDELGDRDKILLRQNVLDGAGIDRLAALYGVHRATAARWLSSAKASLLEGTRQALRRRLKVTPSELDSILRLIQSQLDVSLHRLLS
jgi:RNA polymerase sigma-70 factor, ECF subfamily